MIREDIERKIMKEKGDGDFLYPFYEGYCLSNVPYSVMDIFGVRHDGKALSDDVFMERIDTKGIKKVVLLFVDGFGYDMWLKCNSLQGFFRTFSEKGVLSPITTVFPSTTAAAVTTINTGLTPQEHALPEWTVYFREIAMTIETLPFAPLGSKLRDKLLEAGADPKMLYKGRTVYQALGESGVKSFSLLPKPLDRTAYSQLTRKGSYVIPYIKPSDAVIQLRKALEGENGMAYFNLYIDTVDSCTHFYGPHTEESCAEISNLSYLFERGLIEKIGRETAEETLVLITADHGHTYLDPGKTIYLNKYRTLSESYAVESGRPIPPTGSPRDVFLHIREEKLESMKEFLKKELEGVASVMETKEAMEMELFGRGRPKKEFYERVGNLLVLPYRGKSVWYEHIEGEKFKLLGMHGGLSRDEMLIPLGAARLSELV